MATRFVGLVLVVLTALATPSRADTTINAAIGDASWVATFGRAPDGTVDETTRIRTHLAYVATELRHREVTLSDARRRARSAALTTLEHYAARGVFPRRTGDDFTGRRPRFIDDRGVRCAVGELIAASGHAEVARAIDAEYEYAYVRDMKSAALAIWARESGFTLDELAMIQPSYSAPATADDMKRGIESSKDALTIACAKEGPPQPKITVEVFGLKSGVVRVGTKSTTPFARCFAAHASSPAGGPYNRPIPTYDFTLELTLSPVQPLFERAIAYASDRNNESCTPRPGAIARRASFDVTSDEHGLAIRVQTTPSNTEVESCLEDNLRRDLREFSAGVWKLHATRETTLKSQYDPDRVRALLEQYAGNQATDCYPTQDAPARVKISMTAHVDDPAFAIVVDSNNEPFATCLLAKLQASVLDAYKVSHKLETGKFERYFRIDRDIAVTVDIPVETPAARKERSDRFEKEFQQRNHGY
jgi:hypothetical protein